MAIKVKPMPTYIGRMEKGSGAKLEDWGCVCLVNKNGSRPLRAPAKVFRQWVRHRTVGLVDCR